MCAGKTACMPLEIILVFETNYFEKGDSNDMLLN